MQMTRKQFCNLAALGSEAVVQAPLRVLGDERAPALDFQNANGGKAPPQGITDRVVDFVITARLDAMPAAVVQQGKRCLIDGFGVILAGMVTPGSGTGRRDDAGLSPAPFTLWSGGSSPRHGR